MVMSASRHQDALSAFEEDDSLVTGIQSKLTRFQRKHKKEGKQKEDYYDWIHAQRNLKDAEAALSKQILHASTNVLDLIKKEKYDICPNSRDEFIQDDVAVLQNPAATSFNEIDFLSGIGVRFQLLGENEQPIREYEAKERRALCAQLLLDHRKNLNTSLKELNERYSILSKETQEHRREAMLLLSNDRKKNIIQYRMPQSLSNALDSVRALIRTGHHDDDDDDGVIDMLENDLGDLEDAHSLYKSILNQVKFQSKAKSPCWDEKSQLIFKKAVYSSNASSSSKLLLGRLKNDMPEKSEQEIMRYLEHHKNKQANKQKIEAAARELNRKTQMIENNGLKEVERLRKEIDDRTRRSKANIEIDLKTKEIDLRLRAMRLEREEIQNADADRRRQAAAREVGDVYEKEMHRTQRKLETKQALHQALQTEGLKENCVNELQDDFAVEIQTLKCQQVRRERTTYRQEQIENKRMTKKEADDEAGRAEEVRLERLNALATSVPYYKSIMDKTSDIHKSTEARKNDVYGGRTELADFQCGKLKSFTEDKIFSDSKFRLGNALHEAGLARSTYARDVVRNAIPRAEARTTGIKPY